MSCYSSSSSAAEITGHNEDLITEISLYLPVKSILRFLSVSKQWNSLYSHPSFVQHYSSHSKRNSFLLLPEDPAIDSLNLNGDHQDLRLDIDDFGYLQHKPSEEKHTTTLHLKGSCNGLLLFQLHSRYPINKLYVCNPTTRKYRELALPNYIANPSSELSGKLVFYPRTSPYYKVIISWIEKFSSTTHDRQICIYSSETKTYKKLDCSYNNFIPKTPPSSGPYDPIWYIRGSGTDFHRIYADKMDPVVDVYVLKEDYSRWVTEYKVDFEAIAVKFPQIIKNDNYSGNPYYCRLMCVVEHGEEASMVIVVGNELVAYKFIDKTTKKLCDIPFNTKRVRLYDGEFHYRWFDGAFHCTESLFDV